MKKLIYLIVLMLILGLVISGCSLLGVAPVEKDEASSLKQGKPEKIKPPSGAHYNLNIIGKKADWNGNAGYNVNDRHTMFVPENTDEFLLNDTLCYAPAPLPDGVVKTVGAGVTIWMTEDDEYAVLDGNAFDDCKCEFQLAEGTYAVWIVAKGKPGGETEITGWVYDPDLDEVYLQTDADTIKVSSKGKEWKDATDLFRVEGQWVFEYLATLDPDAAYFWQYINKNTKLVQVRFYKVK